MEGGRGEYRANLSLSSNAIIFHHHFKQNSWPMQTSLLSRENLRQSSSSRTRQYQPPAVLQTTSSFLKKEIADIIKDELKTYNLRNKLEGEVNEYRAKQANQQLSAMVFQDKMSTHKKKEQSIQRKQYDTFLNKQKQREARLQLFKQHKHQTHQQKFEEVNQTNSHVRERHNHLTTEDSYLRMRKLGLMSSQGQRTNRNSSSRALSPSNSQHHCDLIHKINDERESSLVTKYLKKIEQLESRVILKELDNEKRIRTSKKSRVKCLVEQRNKQEVELMLQAEKEYKQRMEHFQLNSLRTTQQKQQVLNSRSLINQNNLKNVAKRRRSRRIKQNEQGTLQSSALARNTILRNYKSSLDLTNDRRNMRNNLQKMRQEADANKLENTMKILTEKLQKIKQLKYGEKLDDRSVDMVLELLDRNDAEFVGLAEFLQLERGVFLEGRVKKEEEQAKLDKMKMNKALNKAGSM